VGRFALGASPTGLASVGSTVWVAAGALTAGAHKGGTLTVVAPAPWLPGAVNGIDPAFNDETAWVHAAPLVYDGLVGLRRTGGVAGLALVPDLATELPRPTDGGRTYSLTLRPGIRYSSGQPVQPEDIRRGVQRVLSLGGFQAAYYTGIVGAQNCPAHPHSCDLSRGVVTDDATRRVSFHLTAADPDFLEKLTIFVYPTPAGTPAARRVTTPLPGTGPYMISDYKPGEKQFTLTRNHNFHQWSYAAQPAGYPDVIRWQEVPDLRSGVTQIVSRRADILPIQNDTPPAELHIIADLARQYPTQLHPDLVFATSYAFLNTAIAPFNDVRVRRALNYAIDRNHLVDLAGGPTLAAPTCQFLPPDLPGYQPYCPYTTSASANGGYQGPDLAAAQQLVAASGTANTPVTVVAPDANRASEEYFIKVLRQLHYRATLREMPGLDDYYRYVFDSRNRVQIGFLYWGADLVSPSNFFEVNLFCRSFVPANASANGNPSEYCRPQIDTLASQALADQTTDPTTARRLWAQIDRMVTDDAPVVATLNGKIDNFVSTRLGNFQSNPQLGPLLDQMWIQ